MLTLDQLNALPPPEPTPFEGPLCHFFGRRGDAAWYLPFPSEPDRDDSAARFVAHELGGVVELGADGVTYVVIPDAVRGES